jgi:hypothetical protein
MTEISGDLNTAILDILETVRAVDNRLRLGPLISRKSDIF